MDDFEEEDDDEYYDEDEEDGIDLDNAYGDEDDEYYDEEVDDDDYYDEDDYYGFGGQNTDPIAPAAGMQEMQITVEISELKANQMRNELQALKGKEGHEVEPLTAVPQKVDNDLESSDLGFSD